MTTTGEFWMTVDTSPRGCTAHRHLPARLRAAAPGMPRRSRPAWQHPPSLTARQQTQRPEHGQHQNQPFHCPPPNSRRQRFLLYAKAWIAALRKEKAPPGRSGRASAYKRTALNRQTRPGREAIISLPRPRCRSSVFPLCWAVWAGRISAVDLYARLTHF